MAQHPVLSDEGSHRRVRILAEQGVMAYTQADSDIQIRFFPVEHPCLEDGVAHGLRMGPLAEKRN